MDKAEITDDYRSYLQSLPPEESKHILAEANVTYSEG